MRITDREADGLLIFVAAEVARRRRARGLRLNHPEAVALISAELLEGIRDGRSVAELMHHGTTILTHDDVMPGIPALIPEIQIEGTFPDGTKLVTVHDPIRGAEGGLVPGEVIVSVGDVSLAPGRERLQLRIDNVGDRPIQVGSHAHLFEVNRYLAFDRARANGFRLDIPAGTAVRFEPGEGREVGLVALAGDRRAFGMAGLVDGPLDPQREQALRDAAARGYLDHDPTRGEGTP